MASKAMSIPERHSVTLTIDGVSGTCSVEPRALLIFAIREQYGVTGPHIGCESGRCGACSVLVDGMAVKSCMMLAVQADGKNITTAAGMEGDPIGAALQVAFKKHHALQCGYCTPGFLSASWDLLARNPNPNEIEIRQALRGNLCRCTGYQHIIDAIMEVSNLMSDLDLEPREVSA